MFRKPFTTLFQASWLSFEAFYSLMRIGFLYYSCLGFDLPSGYTLHYIEYCIGSTEQTGSFLLVAVAGWN